MLNLANKITILRMLITPVVLVLLYFHGPVTCALAVAAFVAAAFTDWYDGYIARHENMVTNMGKFLDPLADKILICAVLIMFTALGWASAWLVIIIVCRELIVTGLRAIAIDEGITMAADKFGKAKTVTQMLAIVPLSLHYPLFGLDLSGFGTFMLFVAMLLAVFSGVNYCLTFYRQLKSKHAAYDA
ncbi:MAG: CDP-diacylglycerol--glycerol-3-phosphate 3-phosphatidyltransferase [Desulfovibrio sp.]|nr:CDP-diacylglycerol--glycerol-3-phosphate 3-phosphatidyltransferase [Desulfovibrio sp.]